MKCKFIFNDRDKIFTTTSNGKILFPHRQCKVDFDSITLLKNFHIKTEKENVGFFVGEKMDMLLPSEEEALELIKSEFSNCAKITVYNVSDKYYFVATPHVNAVITLADDGNKTQLIYTKFYKKNKEHRFNSTYFSAYNVSNTTDPEFATKIDLDFN